MTVEEIRVDETAQRAARTAILDAAASVFASQGFDRTTIDEIADRIGATKGRVYYYFRSKFDIYLAVYEEGMRWSFNQVEPLSTGPGSGWERLVSMSLMHAEHLMLNLSYHNTIHQGINRRANTELKPRQVQELAQLNSIREEYELMFRRVVAEGMADSSIRGDDPTLTARVVLSSLNAIDEWFRIREEQPVEEIRALASRIVDLILGGIGADRARVPPNRSGEAPPMRSPHD